MQGAEFAKICLKLAMRRSHEHINVYSRTRLPQAGQVRRAHDGESCLLPD